MSARIRRSVRVSVLFLTTISVAALAWSLPRVVPAGEPAPTWEGGGPDIGWVTTLYQLGPDFPIYAGTRGGGVFRSIDGGSSWVDISGNLRGVEINDISAVFAGQIQDLYAATEDGGLFRLENFFSDRWTSVNAGLDTGRTPLPVRAVQVHPHDPTMVSIASRWGMHTSNDRGRTWEDSLSWREDADFRDVYVSPRAPNRVYGMEAARSLRWTADHGLNTQSASVGDSVVLADLEFWPASLDTIFMLSPTYGIYRTFNGQDFTSVLPWQPTDDDLLDLTLVEGTEEIYVGGLRALYHSPDLGDTWAEVDAGLAPFDDIYAVLVEDPADRTLLLGSNRGILQTGPGATGVTRQNTGLRAGIVVGIDAWGEEVLITTQHGRIFQSADEGLTWQDRTGNLRTRNANAIVRVTSLGRWIVGSGQRGLWLSDDQGQTWRRPTIYTGHNQVNQLHKVPWEDDLRIYSLTFRGLYESTDGGETWNLNLQVDPDRSITAFGVSEADRSVWVGAFNGLLYRKRDDGPFAPVEVLGPANQRHQALAFPRQDGTEVLLGTQTGLFALVENPDGTYASYETSSGLPGIFGIPNIWDVKVDHATGIYYVALLDAGIFRSGDQGESWQEFNEGIDWPAVQTLELAADRPKPRLYAATFGRGIYGRDLDTSVPLLLDRPVAERTQNGVRVQLYRHRPGRLALWRSVDGDVFRRLATWEEVREVTYRDELAGIDWRQGVELRYEARILEEGILQAVSGVTLTLPPVDPSVAVTRLLPNLPNPFNPRTTLRLALKEPDQVQVDIFDVRGRRVRHVHRGWMPAGLHRFLWSGEDDAGNAVPSGVYLSRVKVGSRVLTGRMTLLR